ncbi:hypothetical protein N7456_007281 [Penicillium angulare]|uniref:Uncharacterized protein n=1 Tax=Penicillium angulare TaxID=116970 RepID=A0A9W9FAB1_9EURO|nr:hypothetical protein N7456_007281 [Penicillium angulare]
MIGTKILATATVAFVFSSSALACVTFKGSTGVHIYVNDNVSGSSVQTCSDAMKYGDQDADCISGYSLNYDYSDNGYSSFPITYCNNQACSSIDVPYTGDCTNHADACAFDYTFGGDC